VLESLHRSATAMSRQAPRPPRPGRTGKRPRALLGFESLEDRNFPNSTSGVPAGPALVRWVEHVLGPEADRFRNMVGAITAVLSFFNQGDV
jgi:hypothetical protein